MTAFVRFVLDADASPGLLPRVLQPFAKRDLTPGEMRVRRDGDTLHVEIVQDAVPDADARLIEGNLRQIVGVRRVARENWAGEALGARPPRDHGASLSAMPDAAVIGTCNGMSICHSAPKSAPISQPAGSAIAPKLSVTALPRPMVAVPQG